MSESRAKLLVLGGPGVPVDRLRALLGEDYDIIDAPPDEASGALEDPAVSAVLASAGDFLPLERRLVDLQSSVLLEAIGEGVCLTDAAGSVLWSNSEFRSLPEDLRSQVASLCAQTAEACAGRPIRPGEAVSRRFDIAHDRSGRFFEVVICPVVARDSGVAGMDAAAKDGAPSAAADREGVQGAGPRMVAVLLDVSGARRMQRKIDAIDRAGRELIQLDTDAVRRLNAAERLAMLEEKVVAYARELLQFDHFSVRLLDRETNRLDLVMCRGFPRRARENTLYLRDSSGISGFVASSGRSYISYDTEQDTRYVEGMSAARSSLTVPLMMRDQIIGVFNVESKRVGAFTEDDRQFAEIFARYVAIALHILDLLVVERYTTNETVTDVMQGEVSEPLEDLAIEAEWLRSQAGAVQDPDAARHIERILRDVDSIRRRVREVARGPRSLLGADRAMEEAELDPALAGKRILVADDEPHVRDSIRQVLKGRGAEVLTCETGQKAVSALERGVERAAEADEPAPQFDLVLSDIQMPDRNGYEVFSAAKAVDPDTPVILMTGFGYDPHHSVVRASQEGLAAVLFKPFQAERLVEEVRKALVQRYGEP